MEIKRTGWTNKRRRIWHITREGKRERGKGNRLIAEADHSFADRVTCRRCCLWRCGRGQQKFPSRTKPLCVGGIIRNSATKWPKKEGRNDFLRPIKVTQIARICAAAASAAVSEIPSEERSVSLFAAVGTFYDRIYPSTEEAAAAPPSDSVE